jgi:DNA-binding NarL/FixJ family response regulator
MDMSPVSIFIVDDHEIVRDGIRALLIGTTIAKVIGEADSPQELFLELQSHQPQVILLDIAMPGGSGLDCLQKLQAEYPDIEVLMLSANTDAKSIHQAVKLGCTGFLPKDCSKKELLEALESVGKGQPYFGKQILPIVFNGFVDGVQNPDNKELPLSEREIEIVICLANGLSFKEVAAQLFISPRTVESHKKTIFEKMQFNNNADLIKYAIRNKLIEL